MGRLEHKIAFVSAAANGIGRATALTFAREGAQVVATDIDADALETLAGADERIATRVLDSTDPGAVADVIASRRFNVIFNCAGWVHQGTIEQCDLEAWRRSFAVNIDSMFYVCRAAIPQMMRTGGGSIVNMSSVASSIKGASARFAYGTTKAAVIGLTRSIAVDYARHGIRCNAVCPGTVETPSLGRRIAALDGPIEEARKSFVDRQPLGRLGTPDEIAALVLYLASDESAFTTGSICIVDGGWSN